MTSPSPPATGSRHDRTAYALAVAIGVILWLAAALLGGKAEAWDASIYWTAAYPLAVLAAGGLGYRFPQRAWRWPLAMMTAQALALAIGAAELTLLPLGLLMFAVLAVPGIALALLGAWLRRRF